MQRSPAVAIVAAGALLKGGSGQGATRGASAACGKNFHIFWKNVKTSLLGSFSGSGQQIFKGKCWENSIQMFLVIFGVSKIS